MLPAVTEVFKTTFDESLKKFVQPAGLVPAALLVLLNLAVIFPALAARGTGALAAFGDLDDLWKAVFVTVLVLVAGYLIASFSSTTARAATGELWRGSRLYDALTAGAKDARRLLCAEAARAEPEREGPCAGVGRDPATPQVATLTDTERHARLYEVHTRYPSEERVGPTTFGNILAATSDALWTGYGIDLTATWSQMRDVLAADPAREKALTDIDAAKVDVDTLLNVAMVALLFAVEGLVILAALGDFSFLTWAAFGLGFGYVAYRAACQKAIAWGDGVQAAYDLYRDEFRDALGVRKVAALSEQRTLWEAASRALLWETISDDLYEEPRTPKSSATTSTTLDATDLSGSLVTARADESPAIVVRRWWIEHRFLVTAARQRTVTPAVSGFLRVKDPRLPERLPAPIVIYEAPPGVEVSRPSVQHPSLELPEASLWEIRGLTPGRALLHAYRYEWERRVAVVATQGPAAGVSFEVDVVPDGADLHKVVTRYDVEVTATALPAPDRAGEADDRIRDMLTRAPIETPPMEAVASITTMVGGAAQDRADQGAGSASAPAGNARETGSPDRPPEPNERGTESAAYMRHAGGQYGEGRSRPTIAGGGNEALGGDDAETVVLAITLRDTRLTDLPPLGGSWGEPTSEGVIVPASEPTATGEYHFDLTMPVGVTYLLKLEVV